VASGITSTFDVFGRAAASAADVYRSVTGAPRPPEVYGAPASAGMGTGTKVVLGVGALALGAVLAKSLAKKAPTVVRNPAKRRRGRRRRAA
jgi:hypothetical protein